MKFAYLSAAAAAALIGSPALAADLTGARVEGIVGYDSPKVDIEELEDFDISLDLDGVLYGVGLGYDFAVGKNVALGIDAEYTDSTSDIEVEDGADSGSISMGRDLYIGGRVTTAISDNFNLFGKVGYTNARVKASYTEDGDTVSEAGNGDGIRFGVGGQYALAGNTYLGLEYRYSNYEADVSRHQVAASLGFRF